MDIMIRIASNLTLIIMILSLMEDVQSTPQIKVKK